MTVGGRVEILQSQDIETPYFTVNTANPTADIVQLRTNHGTVFNGYGVSGLQRGDSFILLSWGFYMPYGFTLYQRVGGGDPNDYLAWSTNFLYKDDGIWKAIPEALYTLYPMGSNYEMAHGQYYDFPKTLNGSQYEIGIETVMDGFLKVDMFGVPSALDGKIYRVPFFIKICHTLPMVAV